MFSSRKKNHASKLKHEISTRSYVQLKKRKNQILNFCFLKSKEICFESRLIFTSNLEDGSTRNNERNYMIPYFNGLSLEQ
jgi:hypothetical protein